MFQMFIFSVSPHHCFSSSTSALLILYSVSALLLMSTLRLTVVFRDLLSYLLITGLESWGNVPSCNAIHAHIGRAETFSFRRSSPFSFLFSLFSVSLSFFHSLTLSLSHILYTSISLSLSALQANLRKFMDYIQHHQVDKLSKMLDRGLDPNYHDPETGGMYKCKHRHIDRDTHTLIALIVSVHIHRCAHTHTILYIEGHSLQTSFMFSQLWGRCFTVIVQLSAL